MDKTVACFNSRNTNENNCRKIVEPQQHGNQCKIENKGVSCIE